MTDEPPRVRDLSPRRLGRLARKELRETLRDRRTILTLVLMPLFVYPLLGLTFQKFLLSQTRGVGPHDRVEYVVGFASAGDAEATNPLMTRGERFLAEGDRQRLRPRAERDLTAEVKADPSGFPDFRAFAPEHPVDDVARLVEDGTVDVGVRLPPPTQGRAGPVVIELVYDPTSPTGTAAKRAVEARLRAANEASYRARLRELGVPPTPPAVVEASPIEPASRGPAATIAAVLPLVLVLMTMTGAVYPAIDLTAGERERGTLEAIVAAPVSGRAVLAAKYVAVFAVAVLTAGMNLAAMTATSFSFGLDRLLFGDGLRATAVAQVVALVLVLAAFFSAVLLLVTSFARSFKEAQAYLIPVMLVSLAPGIVGLMPDLPLTLPLAMTPLIGVVLLGRDLLTSGADGLMIAACVGSTLFYAAVALLLAARAFGADAVLYGSPGTWSELFRRPDEPRPVPPIAGAAGCLAAVVPAFLLLGPIPARIEGLGVGARLAANAALTAFLFVLMPTLAAVIGRADLRSTFRLRAPGPAALAGATLLGLSLWPFAYEAEVSILSEERVGVLKRLFDSVKAQLDAVPLGLKLLTLAAVPAACEEWFFRGFLLSSLRSRVPARVAVLATGAVFGAFHVVVRDGLLFERIVPTALLGFALGAVCVRTGSLWPGVALHMLHNGLLLSLSEYQTQLSEWGWAGDERTHLPWTWLATAAAVATAGGALVWIGRRRSETDAGDFTRR